MAGSRKAIDKARGATQQMDRFARADYPADRERRRNLPRIIPSVLPGQSTAPHTLSGNRQVKRPFVILGALALLLLAGCGSSAPPGARRPSAGETRSKLAGSPAPLRSVHGQANRLLDGGKAALDARVTALHGYPVVVNFWGSWCGPCRDEFPIFQRVALDTGRRVAFLGVDVQDAAAPAKKFLASVPVSYPSYADPQEKIATDFGLIGTPSTAFYDRSGKRTFLHQGPYTSAADLQSDMRRYAGA
jgi:cytochrome c biogenesis protein CcmG, thiol:disulfide interchange protein DsbE